MTPIAFTEIPAAARRIIAATSRYFDVPVSVLRSRSRVASVARVRQTCIYLLRHLTDHSYALIAAWFGRDHATAIHAVRAVELRLDDDEFLPRQIGMLIEAINGKTRDAQAVARAEILEMIE